MSFFENGDSKLYYEETGAGEPLLFLHGASWDSRQWKPQIEYFSNKYHVIVMDARGHGKSSLPPGKVSPDIFWQDVKALLDHLKIKKTIICGLSMGGHVAIQTAVYASERVKALVLIGSPCTNQFNLYEKLCVPINRLSLKCMPMKWLAWCMCFPLGKFQEETKTYIKDVVGATNLVTIKNAHHGTNLDNPYQVNQEIKEFLQKMGKYRDD